MPHLQLAGRGKASQSWTLPYDGLWERRFFSYWVCCGCVLCVVGMYCVLWVCTVCCGGVLCVLGVNYMVCVCHGLPVHNPRSHPRYLAPEVIAAGLKTTTPSGPKVRE